MMMMMNTNCIDCIDVQNPAKISQALSKRRRWAESDAVYLKMISESSRDGAVGGGGGCAPVDEGYARRQRFLRSYKFSQEEETVAQKTKKWFKAKRGGVTARSTPKKEGKNDSEDKKRKGNGDGSCSFLEAVFNFLFLCVAKVDVDDVVLRTRPAKA
ncbi:hypothetical protein EUGRSUZ_H01927 [Eucalyptus grandis]|uniref:Uncharacterized protein n=2 Tax=Eucalyptus grandis TaxID=71139 RepID=A0ACC3JRA8_EUCGR|nr:hypothetical protein EUGRSUZ_H01927 [Eucalyptus grandis]